MIPLYNKYSTFLKKKYGAKVRKLSIDAGYICPNQKAHGKEGCIFCRNDSFSQMQSKQNMPVKLQVLQGIEFAKKRFKSTKFLAYFQSSTNTFAPIQTLKNDFYDAISHPDVVGLVISTRPDCLGPAVMALIHELSQKIDVTLELGLQSIHDNTLMFLNRGHTFQDYVNAVDNLLMLPVRICTHLMIGLPGESYDDTIATAKAISANRTHEVKIHPLLILKGTEIARLYHDKKIQSLEMSEYCAWAVDVLELLPPEMVIQRLTAEALGEVLIAPMWSKNKLRVLQTIEKEFIRRGTYQGYYFNSPLTRNDL